MTLTLTDILAILGALAWAPPLISLIKHHYKRAEVRIITQKFAEIGFTTYGPIFNMRVAFSIKHQDIVISNLKIRIKHEYGEEKTFEWQGIRQHVMKMNTADGPIPYEKENSVLAIKLNQKEVEERIIQCQEMSFITGKKISEDKAILKLTYEREKDTFDPMSFLQSQECADIYTYIKHAFSWKAGKYQVIYELDSPEKFNLIDNSYEFSLLPIDIEYLEKNKNNVEQDYINAFFNESNDNYKKIIWNWRNPPIYLHNEG